MGRGLFYRNAICAFVLTFSNRMQLLYGALSNFIEIGVNANPMHHFIDLDKAITILIFCGTVMLIHFMRNTFFHFFGFMDLI